MEKEVPIVELWNAPLRPDVSPGEIVAGLVEIRKAVTRSDIAEISGMIEDDLLPKLITFLRWYKYKHVRYEIALIFNEISQIDSTRRHQIVGAGAVPHLIKLVTVLPRKVGKLAMLALGNIMSDGIELSKLVLDHGYLEALLELVPRKSKNQRMVSAAMLHVCRNTKYALTRHENRRILSALGQMIGRADTRVLVNTVAALVAFTDGGYVKTNLVYRRHFVRNLMPLLQHRNTRVNVCALRVLANVSYYSYEQTDHVLDAGLLTHMPGLLTHKNSYMRRRSVWLLSSVSDGDGYMPRTQAIIDAGLLPHIITKLSDDDYGSQKAAALTVSRITAMATREQVLTLVRGGVLEPFVDLLAVHPEVILQGLLNMLERSRYDVDEVTDRVVAKNILEDIAKLQHEHYRQVVAIICCFFPDDVRLLSRHAAPSMDANSSTVYIDGW